MQGRHKGDQGASKSGAANDSPPYGSRCSIMLWALSCVTDFDNASNYTSVYNAAMLQSELDHTEDADETGSSTRLVPDSGAR